MELCLKNIVSYRINQIIFIFNIHSNLPMSSLPLSRSFSSSSLSLSYALAVVVCLKAVVSMNPLHMNMDATL